MLWSPAKVAIAGVLAWLFFRLVAPVRAIEPLATSAVLFVILCYACFFVGCLLAERREKHKPGLSNSGPDINAGYEIGLFYIYPSGLLGLLGIGLRYVDRIYLRGIDYSLQSIEIREALGTSEVGFLGIIGAALMSLCFVPLIILLSQNSQKGLLKYYCVALPIFLLPMVEGLAQLSRSSLLVTIALLFFAITCTRMNGNPFNRRLFLFGIAGLIGLMIASTVIFSTRLEDSGRSLDESILNSVYAQKIGPTDAAVEGLLTGGPVEREFYSVILPNSLYYLSGQYEFSALWTRPDEQVFSYGGYTFSPFVRVFTTVTGVDPPNFEKDNITYRVGVFNGFMGPIWIDFGWGALVVMALFGFGATRLSVATRGTRPHLLPIYLYVAVIIFYMPVVNLFLFGNGTFALSSFVVFAMISRRASGTAHRRTMSRHGASVRKQEFSSQPNRKNAYAGRKNSYVRK
jgi:hypothetical protein